MDQTDIENEQKRERQFLSRLQETVKRGRKNGGTISEEELTKTFQDLDLSDEQMQQVRDYLKVNHIGIDEPLPAEEVLTEEEHSYLDDYIELLSQMPPLPENVLEAIRLSAMAGEPSAQRELAQAMLPQVVDIAKLYAGQGVYMEDLIGAGNEALARGVGLLAPLESQKEVDGFLARRIMDAMEDLIAQNLDEKAADSQVEDQVNKVADKARELASLLGRKVTVEELAREGEVTEEEIRDALRISGFAIPDIESENKSGRT